MDHKENNPINEMTDGSYKIASLFLGDILVQLAYGEDVTAYVDGSLVDGFKADTYLSYKKVLKALLGVIKIKYDLKRLKKDIKKIEEIYRSDNNYPGYNNYVVVDAIGIPISVDIGDRHCIVGAKTQEEAHLLTMKLNEDMYKRARAVILSDDEYSQCLYLSEACGIEWVASCVGTDRSGNPLFGFMRIS